MKKKILLAEDEEQIAKLVRFKLDYEGFDVSVVKNGQEAIDHILREEWDLLILDVMMPVKSGIQVLEELRVKKSMIPVLVLSAKGYQKDIDHAFELGASQYLKKPFSPDELASLAKKMSNA